MKIHSVIYLLCFIACAFLLTGKAQATELDIRIDLHGDDSYPPYSYSNEGKPDGIYTRILERVAERISGYDIVIKMRPWKRLIGEAEQGDIFGVFPPYFLGDRRPFFTEYSVPILAEESITYCGKKLLYPPRPNWPEDYFGLTIGNNLGFALGGPELEEAMDQGKIKVENTAGTINNIRKLLAGRIDCYINDRIAILWNIRQMKRNGNWPYQQELAEGTTINREYGYLALSGNFEAPYRHDFLAKFNAIILNMQESGEIDRIALEFIQ